MFKKTAMPFPCVQRKSVTQADAYWVLPDHIELYETSFWELDQHTDPLWSLLPWRNYWNHPDHDTTTLK